VAKNWEDTFTDIYMLYHEEYTNSCKLIDSEMIEPEQETVGETNEDCSNDDDDDDSDDDDESFSLVILINTEKYMLFLMMKKKVMKKKVMTLVRRKHLVKNQVMKK
jgi:hypothetical protein